MATEDVADVAHGWHVFLLWVCRYYDTQFVEFFMILLSIRLIFLLEHTN